MELAKPGESKNANGIEVNLVIETCFLGIRGCPKEGLCDACEERLDFLEAEIACLRAENEKLKAAYDLMADACVAVSADFDRLKNQPLAEHPLIAAVCEKYPDGWDLTFNGSTVDDENHLWSAGSVEDSDGKTPDEALQKAMVR